MSDWNDRYNLLIRLFVKLFRIDIDERYGRKEVAKFVTEEIEGKKISQFNILDIAAGTGTDLLNAKKQISDAKNVRLHANEAYKPNVDILKGYGIEVVSVDIEREKLPFDNESIDIIIANQILEHCKELFWIFNEMQRVLKHDGVIVIGVPNLASVHCRLMLLFGLQPPCIETLGPHVRGFTFKDFKWFIESGGGFKIEKYLGSGHYSIVPGTSRLLARLFPKSAVTMILKVRKTKENIEFVEYLNKNFLETNYFVGEIREADWKKVI